MTVLGEPPAVAQGPWEATVTWVGAASVLVQACSGGVVMRGGSESGGG